jgi:C4-dicarboxylate-specific signal transduction histidine kinase
MYPGHALHAQAALLQRLATPWAMLSIVTQDGLPGLEFSAEILERITVNLVLNAAEALRSAAGVANPRHSLHGIADPSAERAGTQEAKRGWQAEAEPKSGRIRVSLRVLDGRLRLSVEDNGPGVPPAIAAAFLRPSPLPPGAARGLGHHIVHELATATGGQLSIQTRPGAGTTFSLDWPVRMATSALRPDGASLRLVSSAKPLSSVPAAPAANSARSQAVAGGLETC